MWWYKKSQNNCDSQYKLDNDPYRFKTESTAQYWPIDIESLYFTVYFVLRNTMDTHLILMKILSGEQQWNNLK